MRTLETEFTHPYRGLFRKKSPSNLLIYSDKKNNEKFFQKSVARVKNWCTFASAIDRDVGCKFFESNEPIKSSLKGKEPKIPMRLETGESARQTEKNIKYNNIQ